MSDLHKRKRIMKHLIKKKQKQPTKEKSRTDLQKKKPPKQQNGNNLQKKKNLNPTYKKRKKKS
jgi:hypothetical protein